ncbi:MAG: TIGR03086 family metal-binding protein [Acidimicrobiales bacterium]
MDIAEVHATALDATGVIVAGVGESQWALPTPCDDWDVRTLVNHIVTGNEWAAELAGGKSIEEVGDRLDGDVLGDDALVAYNESARRAAAAFRAPGALVAPCAVSYGPVPGEVYAGHRLLDTLLHGWDVAKATNQPTNLDPSLVKAALAVLIPQADLLAGSGAFGTSTDPGEDADPQVRLLALTGRRD